MKVSRGSAHKNHQNYHQTQNHHHHRHLSPAPNNINSNNASAAPGPLAEPDTAHNIQINSHSINSSGQLKIPGLVTGSTTTTTTTKNFTNMNTTNTNMNTLNVESKQRMVDGKNEQRTRITRMTDNGDVKPITSTSAVDAINNANSNERDEHMNLRIRDRILMSLNKSLQKSKAKNDLSVISGSFHGYKPCVKVKNTTIKVFTTTTT